MPRCASASCSVACFSASLRLANALDASVPSAVIQTASQRLAFLLPPSPGCRAVLRRSLSYHRSRTRAIVTHCPQYQVNLLLLFDPSTDVFGLVAKMTADTPAFRACTLVPPLVKSRYRDTAEVCRDILGSPEPILSQVGDSCGHSC